jgi:hypothetical protein
MNIDRIITEAINKVVKEAVVDKFTPYSPEQAKINKMGVGRMGNPSYDNAEKADTSVKSNFSYPTPKEWQEKYPNMSYGEYCEKIHGVKKR